LGTFEKAKKKRNVCGRHPSAHAPRGKDQGAGVFPRTGQGISGPMSPGKSRKKKPRDKDLTPGKLCRLNFQKEPSRKVRCRKKSLRW